MRQSLPYDWHSYVEPAETTQCYTAWLRVYFYRNSRSDTLCLGQNVTLFIFCDIFLRYHPFCQFLTETHHRKFNRLDRHANVRTNAISLVLTIDELPARSGYGRRKRNVLRRWLNIASDGAEVTYDGRLFQKLAPETGKARLPTVERLNHATASSLKEVDRSLCRYGTSVTRVKYDDIRCRGALPFTAR